MIFFGKNRKGIKNIVYNKRFTGVLPFISPLQIINGVDEYNSLHTPENWAVDAPIGLTGYKWSSNNYNDGGELFIRYDDTTIRSSASFNTVLKKTIPQIADGKITRSAWQFTQQKNTSGWVQTTYPCDFIYLTVPYGINNVKTTFKTRDGITKLEVRATKTNISLLTGSGELIVSVNLSSDAVENSDRMIYLGRKQDEINTKNWQFIVTDIKMDLSVAGGKSARVVAQQNLTFEEYKEPLFAKVELTGTNADLPSTSATIYAFSIFSGMEAYSY